MLPWHEALGTLLASLKRKKIRTVDVFNRMKKNKRGLVDRETFEHILEKFDLQPKQARALFLFMDKDGDKAISLVDFNFATKIFARIDVDGRLSSSRDPSPLKRLRSVILPHNNPAPPPNEFLGPAALTVFGAGARIPLGTTRVTSSEIPMVIRGWTRGVRGMA
jgi:hypothetical protein